jgi:hypothetical protein
MEGALFILGQCGLGATQLSAENYTSYLVFNFGSAADLVAQNYPLSAFNFTELPPVFLAISTIITDASYSCPADLALNLAV